jgi:hypothetical protein
MNKHKLPVLGLGLMLLIASCKKNDVQHESKTTNPAPVATALNAKSSSEWTSVSNWSSSKAEKFTTYNSSIGDSSITSAVAGSGLVLTFAKSGDAIKSLPFQEKGTTDAYWYYQVSKGTITLSCDVYSGTPALNTSGFKYFIFSPEQLKDLEAKGHSKTELMQLSYEGVAALLNK